MARAMCKWSVVVHAVVLAVELLDAESARGSGHRRFFKRPTERKKRKRATKGEIGANKGK